MGSTDTQADAPDAPAWRRIPAGYIIAAGIVAAISLALVGRHLYFRSKINAEHDAIHKAGFPVTLQELDDYYPAPQGNNAAYVYSSAFLSYPNESSLLAADPAIKTLPVVGPGKLPPRGEPLPKETQTTASAYLTSYAQALGLLHQAAAIPDCRFDLDWTQGEAIPLPHLAALRQAARLFQLQALMKAEEGKPDEAAAATADSFATARALRNEPIHISQLVRIAADNISIVTLERVLSRTPLTDKQLTELSSRIAAEDDPEPFLRGIVGERCIGESLFLSGDWQKGGVISNDPKVSSVFAVFYRVSGMEAQDHLMYLKLMSEMVSVGAGAVKDMRERPVAMDKKIMEVPKSMMITRMFVPAFTRAYEEQLKLFARLRAARAGIAVERFRVANGRLPESLDELAPKWLDSVPTDPFDDKPIRYKKLIKGFVTYSVGPDLKDNGGKERGPKNYNAPFDITFTIER
jgi:hypothetical protein